MRLLLANGTNVNCKFHDETALMAAAVYGHTKCVDLLIRNRADVNATKSGVAFPSRQTAATSGSLSCLKLLLKAGARVNVKNASVSMLLLIVFQNHPRCKKPDIIMTLIDAGEKIDLNILDTKDFENLQNLELSLDLKHSCRKSDMQTVDRS